MTDNELKKMSRAELVELLLEQSREIRSLRQQLDAAQAQLDDKVIKLNRVGSIAEAALALNGVFEAADAACKQYIDTVQTRMKAYERQWGENNGKKS